MEKNGLYNRGSILLSKSKKSVNKNFSLADKEHSEKEEAMKKRQGRMAVILLLGDIV